MIVGILTGGESKRMGQDKHRLILNGKSMLKHLIDAVKSASLDYLVIGKIDDTIEGIKDHFCEDIIKGLGPLSGLYTLFKVSKKETVILLATDIPFITSDLIRYLAEYKFDEKYDAAIPFVNGREQGLTAIYRKSAIDKNIDLILGRQIQFNQFRISLDKKIIDEDSIRKIDKDLKSFININDSATLKAYSFDF